MIRFSNYKISEILGGLFEIYEGPLTRDTVLYGGLHMFYHKDSDKLLVPSEELNYVPRTAFYRHILINPCSRLRTMYWFLSLDDYRKFYKTFLNLRRVDKKSWNGLCSKFDQPGSINHIILELKENVKA